MASQALETTLSHSGVTKGLLLVASIENPKMIKGIEVAPNPVVLVTLTGQVMLPFSIGSSTVSFIGPLLDQKEAEQVCPFFPCLKNRDIVASQEKIHCRYFTSSARPFRNNPENMEDYIKWLDRVEPSMEKA